jgi:hypothetical protein
VLGVQPDGSTTFQVLNMKGSHALWDIPIGQRFVYEYNSMWQPIGMSAMKFRRMTGSIVKSGNFVRMRDDW